MAQMYFLSIVTLIIAGLTVAGDYFGERFAFLASFRNLRQNRSAQIIIGSLAALVGFLKLFVLSPGEHIYIVGDLLPAATGVLLGAVLLIESFRIRVQSAGENVEKVAARILTFSVPLGIAGVIVASVHFLLPEYLIL
jgi:hypothetical protein